MSTLERDIEARLRGAVQALGGVTIKLAPVERGIPDRLVLLPGRRVYLVELKTATGRLTPMQQHWHAKVLERTGIAVVTLYGMDQVRAWLALRTEEQL